MLLRTRRAPSACSWCRYRKVRCDASILGCPCTRCRQDGRSHCVLRARFRHSRVSSNPSRPGFTTDREQHFSQDPYDKRVEDVGPPEYPFIDSQFLSSLPPEDVAFLFSKGCRTLPDEDAIDEFARQYFKRLHPSVPVVDEVEFWRIVYQQDGCSGKISLFVFQAILFAGCPFVSLTTLRRCGFADKRDARKQLYNRAKLLFELKAETRPSIRAQGAVLLTHHSSAEDPRAGSLWLMRAVESAIKIDAQPSLLVENVPQSSKKRLWWSILLRDRSLCIGLRRRSQVPVEYYCDWLTEEDFADEIQHSRTYDEATKLRLLQALQQQCRLAVLLTDLVSLIFAPRAIPSCCSLSMEQFDGLMSTINRIKLSLVEWEESQTLFPPSTPSGSSNLDEPADILTNLTFMYYHTARVDLAQYAAYMIEENLSFAKNTLYDHCMLEIGQDLKHGIGGLTSAMEYFSIQGNLESLPLSVLGYVGMPLILSAIDMKLSPSYDQVTTRQKRMHSLSAIIRHSETLYDVTDFVATGINHLLRLAYLTTKTLFLGGNQQPFDNGREIMSGNITSTDVFHPAGGRSNQQTLKSPGRATSWIDAFVLSPRAYLLISTSVDYSLAMGRLPYNNALPELVRDIPAMGSVLTLPWTINLHHVSGVRHPPLDRRARNQSRVRSHSASSDERARRQHRQSGVQSERTITDEAQGRSILDDAEAGNLPVPTNTQPRDDNNKINLNYMEFGNTPSTTHGCLFPQVDDDFLASEPSSPKDCERGLGQEGPGDNVSAGTPFNSVSFDNLTLEFLRGSWDDEV